MTEERRNYLLNKLTKKISGDIDDEIELFEEKYYSQNFKDYSIPYDPKIIESIINEYDFPKNYNYLEDTNCTTEIKDQQHCGCCWSHAATTALAYRYHKIGIDVSLSPQDALSCYLKDCDAGNYLIDSQMNLVKNGTLTEGCLPFSSGDGIHIEECPTTCKDGSEFKKYYSQNAYLTQDYYSEDTFYEIVALIMDQLINKGPVVTGIKVYQDFVDLHSDPERCHNEVYTHNEEYSNLLGGHAVVIVGYGYMDSKYYWLIQNSWGEAACDHGFVKIEFGQITVESVAFSEPYVHKDIIFPTNIPIKLENFDGECIMKVSSTASFDEWENTLDISFKNTESKRPFNIQCSSVNIIQGQKSVCYYEYYNYFTEKGLYKFDNYQSLGNENTFSLNSELKQKEFFFYGLDEYEYILSYNLYVSQEGSKILLFYYNYGDERTDILGPIYPTINAEKSLSDCKYIYLGGNDFVYCDIKKDELDEFQDMSTSEDYPLVSQILCGYKEEMWAAVYKLDITKYPVFKINKFILPPGNTIKNNCVFTLIANIEGSLSEFHSIVSYFYALIEIETMGQNFTSLIECELFKPNKIKNNYSFNCYLMSEGEEIPYDKIYLHPYSIPYDIEYPYEIYIKEMIKGEEYDTKLLRPKIQVFIESLCPDCVDFITNSFRDFYEKVEKPNLVDIEFIPFGNAEEKYNETTKKYDFTCQHGEKECYGNLVETCAINIMGRTQSYEVILCIESNILKYEKDFDKTLGFCLSNDEETLQQIKYCVDNDIGNFYEHLMAQKTSEHFYVPWIVVDGNHDVDVENQILESLIDYVCGDDRTKCYSN